MRRFEVDWDNCKLERTVERVKLFQMPRVPADAGWHYGCAPAFLKDIRRHWIDRFDATNAARQLNHFPQGLVTIDGIDLHVVHVIGEAQGR